MKNKQHFLFIFFLIFTLVSSIITPNVFASYSSSYAEPSILIKVGCYGSGVRWVQDMLKNNGYSLDIDGSFGPKTLVAVEHFQTKYNLKIDGIVGQETRTALKKYANSSTSNVTNNSNTDTNIMYTSSNLNLRQGPSTGYPILLTIPKNSKVSIISKTNNWFLIKYNSVLGYASKDYLSQSKPSISNNIINSTYALPAFSRNSSKLIDIIKNCKSYYANNNFVYSTATGIRNIPADKSIIHDSTNRYYTDCSNYVSWALYEYAMANKKTDMKNYFSYQRSSSTFKSIGENGGNSYLKVIDKKTPTSVVNLEKAQPGDILVSNGHVEFFNSYSKNSNGTISLKVYNCGSTSSIKVERITISATKNLSDITYILRVK